MTRDATCHVNGFSLRKGQFKVHVNLTGLCSCMAQGISYLPPVRINLYSDQNEERTGQSFHTPRLNLLDDLTMQITVVIVSVPN
jgi:hypothetical protein